MVQAAESAAKAQRIPTFHTIIIAGRKFRLLISKRGILTYELL